MKSKSLKFAACAFLAGAVAAPSTAFGAAQEKNFTQDVAAIKTFERSTGVDVTGDRVQLTRSFLVQDEKGNTDQKQGQPLSASMWAKKTFVLPVVADAQIIFYGSASKITVNGHEAKAQPTSAGQWLQVQAPAAWLKAGNNEVIFSGGGGLLIENSLFPDRSARSIDGGKTWLKDELGPDGIQNGEYLVRVRVKAYAPRATVTSNVIDLLDSDGKRLLRPRATINAVRLSHAVQMTQEQVAQPAGTSFTLQARTGPTSVFDPATWTTWTAISGDKDVPALKAARFVQWQAVLSTKSPDKTPSFNAVRVIANIDEAPLPANVKVTALDSHPIVAGSYPYAFQKDTARLKILRDRYKLKDVVAAGKTQLEQQVLLRNWGRHQWANGWAHNNLSFVPPWDALLILDMAPREEALGMCTHYSTVFVQTALALGFNARHLILAGHCAAEIWNDDLGKWIVMDAGNSADPTKNCHFELDGVPLNALEIHKLVQQNQVDKIRVVYSPGRPSINGGALAAIPDQIQFTNYVRFSTPFRNNHLDTPFPGELEQGEAHYFHDGYLWWQDGPVPTGYPEYESLTYRPQDFYWNLNQVALDLRTSEAADKIEVGLATQTPNFSHYLVRVDGGEWQKQNGPTVTWPLHAGSNRVEVKIVNVFGREGKASSATVEMG